MIRSFLAIELPATLKKRLAEYSARLKDIPSAFKWVNPDQIHLTLKFFGSISQDLAAQIGEVLAPFLAGKEPFSITLHGFGGFPNFSRPRVIWVGLGGEKDRLIELQKNMDDLLAPLGIPREERPFQPHLTLGRNKAKEFNPSFKELLAKWEKDESDPFEIREVILFRSDLKPAGPIYTKLKEMPLKSENDILN
jgi:RNA 2',3'-cyclic 3'-phosphodiesterase